MSKMKQPFAYLHCTLYVREAGENFSFHGGWGLPVDDFCGTLGHISHGRSCRCTCMSQANGRPVFAERDHTCGCATEPQMIFSNAVFKIRICNVDACSVQARVPRGCV